MAPWHLFDSTSEGRSRRELGVREPGFRLCFSCFLFCLHRAACGILVPQPGVEPMPPALGTHRFLTTEPPGKSLHHDIGGLATLSPGTYFINFPETLSWSMSLPMWQNFLYLPTWIFPPSSFFLLESGTHQVRVIKRQTNTFLT